MRIPGVMKVVTTLALAISILTGLCVGVGLLPDYTDAVIGENVTFSTNLDLTDKPLTQIAWTVNSTNIININLTNPLLNVTGPGYEDRIALNGSTGSLELKSLTLKDSGNYSVITTIAGEGFTILSLYDKITGVNITTPPATLVAGRDSTNLTCDAAGSIVTRAWMKEGQPLSPSDRVSFSGDNRTVSISPVTSTDNGEYQCRVSNPVSSDSASHRLTVNFGPERRTILAPEIAEVGTTTLLYCSIKSVPPANFNWLFNGEETGVHEAGYLIDKSSHNNSGEYTCAASNDVTGLKVNLFHTLTVRDISPSPASSLSPGAAAGVAVGVMSVVVFVVIAVFVYFTRYQSMPKDCFGTDNQSSRDIGLDNTQFTGHYDTSLEAPRDSSHNTNHPDLRDRDHTYQNIRDFKVAKAPPIPTRKPRYYDKTNPDMVSEYDTKMPG